MLNRMIDTAEKLKEICALKNNEGVINIDKKSITTKRTDYNFV